MASKYSEFNNPPNVETAKESEEKKQASKIVDHRLSVEEVYAKYSSSIDLGLTDQLAEQRLLADGPNTFTPPKEKSWIWLLFKELTGGFALLLWFSGIASFVSYFIEKKIEDVSNVVRVCLLHLS